MKPVSILKVAENITCSPTEFYGFRTYYATADINGAYLLDGTLVNYAERPSRANLVAINDDILFAKMKATDKVVHVNCQAEDALFSTGFFNLRPNPQCLDARFLFWFLRSTLFHDEKDRRCTGATQKSLTLAALREIKIPLPDDLSEQRRISDILDSAESIRRKCQQAQVMADQLLRSTFLEMFGDPVLNTKNLPTISLGELIKVSSGNGLTAKNMNPNGVHPVYGGNGINGFHSEYLFEEPQVVIGRVGEYCGAVHLTKPKSWVTDNALYVREYRKPVNRVFLQWALKIANLNQFAGRAAQPLISGNRIYPIKIALPDKNMQSDFSCFVHRQNHLVTKLTKILGQTRDLFSALSRRAFRGEL